jgi:hypothetical protein
MIYGKKPQTEIVGEPMGTSGPKKGFFDSGEKREMCKKKK